MIFHPGQRVAGTAVFLSSNVQRGILPEYIKLKAQWSIFVKVKMVFSQREDTQWVISEANKKSRCSPKESSYLRHAYAAFAGTGGVRHQYPLSGLWTCSA